MDITFSRNANIEQARRCHLATPDVYIAREASQPAG